MLFDFLQDMGNYEARKVDRYEKGGVMVSTAAVSDGAQPFETGIAHPEYNRGSVIVVEAYSSKKAAQTGHKKWVKLMTARTLPEELIDCGNSVVSKFAEVFDVPLSFPRERPKAKKAAKKRAAPKKKGRKRG